MCRIGDGGCVLGRRWVGVCRVGDGWVCAG